MEYHPNRVSSLDLVGAEPVLSPERLGAVFLTFVAEYKTTHKSYFHQLEANLTRGVARLAVRVEDVAQFSPVLGSALERSPLATVEVWEAAVAAAHGLPSFEIGLTSGTACIPLRAANASAGGRIVRVRGIIVSTTAVSARPKELFLTCRSCLGTRIVRDVIPRACERPGCPLDPYVVVSERCTVLDSQAAKLQEDFEDVPAGESPRHLTLVLEGGLVDGASPGHRIAVTGVLVVAAHAAAARTYLRVLGIEDVEPPAFCATSEAAAETLRALAKTGAYERVSRSIAPAVFGCDDVKKALACLLFGGTRRVREDGISLRGDINILLLGDPGIAKSQLLRFVATVAPVGVYTSGKGSSAAGLTAAVSRDKSGAWALEGGALVLADGGVCAIDEFDKMREADRVAIHEAMEQQTISIAKAGITTVLNTRVAVLAAANPAFGRYDDDRTAADNIEFGSTILSRFDCIFILRDAAGPGDAAIAEHVVALHADGAEDPEALDVATLRAYVTYARRISPTLSPDAAARLSRFYVAVRAEAATGTRGPIPITVRQLESLVRLSEALARMELTAVVTAAHVDEAIRLFQVSTMRAVAQGHAVEGMACSDEMQGVVARIRSCMPVGAARSFSEVARAVGGAEALVRRAVDIMVRQNKMLSRDYGRVIVRLP